MRTTVAIDPTGNIDWEALRPESDFLYRVIADEGRAVLGVGVKAWVEAPEFDGAGVAKDWYFGALEYEWTGALDRASARTPSPRPSWLVPKWVLEWTKGQVLLHAEEQELTEAMHRVDELLARRTCEGATRSFPWTLCTGREAYIAQVHTLLKHIQRGDIYEINYCIERTTPAVGFDPFQAFARSLANSRAPFAGFHRRGDRFALCASPERYLAFRGNTVKGQPMKGTRPRSLDPMKDRALALELAADPKERSENIMALDVMRNDLSRIAASRTVIVDALCEVIPFPHVHQMISTVSATLGEGYTPYDAVRASFPMASMTGAPKIRAMQLIESAELGTRGLFSGSLGFFAPDGTGDLNVVIRTALFDADQERISLRTGSAITARCEPEREWEECTLKARSVIEALDHVA